MLAHLIQGKRGSAFGKENNLGIVIVDALRASATATMLLHFGAIRILVVDEVDKALQLKTLFPDAMLFGERHGLPPAGFDYGNSPRETKYARGREVIFTTTTGARLLFEGYSETIPFMIMATTINANAVCQFLKKQNKDFVIVPAGLYDDYNFPAQEDWTTASYIISLLNINICHGKEEYEYWEKRIEDDGIEKLFETAPHAEKLRKVGLSDDILWCAQVNISATIPIATKKEQDYIVLEKFSKQK
ncbi:MAG TPA: 2-phosphosulfolactate phosphatase [Candidatus Hydrogenedens sp.]|nr:2-phosphosulfolactate phosphatase [Candidatus Hydrogenedens sp.]